MQRNFVQKIKEFFDEGMWSIDVDALGFIKRSGLHFVRFLSVTLRGFINHHCALHAAGLTYFSILSIIPVLLLMLMLTKPCGMYDWAREKLRVRSDMMISTFFESNKEDKFFASAAAEKSVVVTSSVATKPADVVVEPVKTGNSFAGQARELRDQILGQIDEKINNFNFGLLAIVGFVMLAWTVISTVGQVEDSFNEIWNVEKGRSIWRKAYLYTGTLMVLPLLLALAMSLPVLRLIKASLDATLGATSYTKWVGDAIIALLDSSLFSFAVTFAFTSLALSFLFKTMPNCRVTLRAALEGGVVTAALLGVWLRVCSLVQFGIAGSSAAYGSFALIPILIVWIFMSWKIILLGSNMTYAFQCIHSRMRELPRT